MAIRKRIWLTARGEQRERWIVDYVDQHRHRHIKTFNRKMDAENYRASVKVDVRAGVHTAPSRSITVARASGDWLVLSQGEGLRQSTLATSPPRCAQILP